MHFALLMKRIFTDQMNRQVEINFPPKRIVSLVPSQTELLYQLGLTDEVVGQTVFCIHPDHMHQTKPRVGGTKKLQFDKIKQLKPDLIIGNKEENDQSQIEELMKNYPVWMSDISNLEDALDMIKGVGEIVDKKEQAHDLSYQIYHSFSQLQTSNMKPAYRSDGLRKAGRLQTAYLIWRNPYMAAGYDTFINDMMTRCGLENVFKNETSRYPEINKRKLQTSNPQLILLSSEPYPFAHKHVEELSIICPGAKIILADGELFSWYGSRLLKSAAYFLNLKSVLALS